MIECGECTKEMSSKAVACPHCGHPAPKPRRRHPFFRWLFRLAMVLFILAVGNAIHLPFHNTLDRVVSFLPNSLQRPTQAFVDRGFHIVFSHTPRKKDPSESNHEGGH